MAKKSKAPKPSKKISLQSFKRMTLQDLEKFSAKELQQTLRQVRDMYYKRAQTLEKNVGKGNFYSHAYEQPAYVDKRGNKHYIGIREWYEDQKAQGKIKAPSRTKKDDAMKELSRLHMFFNAQTSTVKGTREVAREQDIAIFGEDPTKPGMPRNRMTRKERTKFWALYNEFSTSSTYAARFWQKYSDMRQAIGRMVLGFRRGKRDFTQETLADLMKELDDLLTSEESAYEYEALEVVSGTGDDFYF